MIGELWVMSSFISLLCFLFLMSIGTVSKLKLLSIYEKPAVSTEKASFTVTSVKALVFNKCQHVGAK